MDLGKTKVDDLVAKGRLWVLTIFMKDQCPRFGPGLFNRSKTYGTQTATVHRIRDKFYTEPEHYFVVRSDDLSEVCEDFLEDVKLVPSNGFGKFFPKHPQHAFLQGGDYASTEIIDDETKAEVNSGFRDWFHYNTFVGYGNIMDHEDELRRLKNGEFFEAEVQVFAVSEKDNYTYLACLKLPDDVQRLQVGKKIDLRWHEADSEEVLAQNAVEGPGGELQEMMSAQHLDNLDLWRGEIIEPLPAAPHDTISAIIHRPSKESPDARVPKIVDSLEDPLFETVRVRIPISEKIFKRFLACNHDLQHWSKEEVAKELLGGDLMELPKVNLLEGVEKSLIETTIAKGRVKEDLIKIIHALPNLHGRFFTVTGPAGSGKSYVMTLLSLLLLKGSAHLYPVHPDGTHGAWMPNFQNYKKGERDPEEEPDKKRYNPQIVISCPTNSLSSENCVKIQRTADDLFNDESIMIIRIHPLELELLIADQSYTVNDDASRPTESEQNEDDLYQDGLVRVLKSVLTHYEKSKSSTVSDTPGINDNRLQHMNFSLGYRMLQVCGIIPDSPWTISGKYPNFLDFYKDRLEEGVLISSEQEMAFKKDLKRLARDTMAMAQIVIGTPFVLGTSLMYHSLHPTSLFIDEAGMSKEADLLLLLTYYFPKAIGLFGDPKQLGPTILSTWPQNYFYRQLAVPLLSRMVINGIQGFELIYQNRLVGNIHTVINRLFYGMTISGVKREFVDPDGWELKVKKFNSERFNVNRSLVFVNVPNSQESSMGFSWANRGHVWIALDLAFDLMSRLSVPPTDIVVLVGYDGQRRAYLSELSRRANRQSDHGDIQWMEIRVHVIETFQGNEAPFAIFDFVRSTTMGHMRSFRRLNVGMSRARFGLWCLYNENALKSKIDSKTWIISELRQEIRIHRLGASVQMPSPEDDPEDDANIESSQMEDPRSMEAISRKWGARGKVAPSAVKEGVLKSPPVEEEEDVLMSPPVEEDEEFPESSW